MGLGAEDNTDKEERKRKREERKEERKTKREEKKNEIEIDPVIIEGDLDKCKVVTPELRKELRNRKRFYRKESKYMKWLSQGKTRKADRFENWVLRNFSQNDIEELIGAWPWTPDYTDGFVEGNNRDKVESDNVFARGADRMNEKLKQKYRDNPATPATNSRGEPYTDTIPITSMGNGNAQVVTYNNRNRDSLINWKVIQYKENDTVVVAEY